MKQRGRTLSPERMELLAKLVEDGWPIRQMIATHGFNFATVKKHYPNYHSGITQSEAGKMSMAMRYLDRKTPQKQVLCQ